MSSSLAFLLIPPFFGDDFDRFVDMDTVLSAGDAAPDLEDMEGAVECARAVDGLVFGGRMSCLLPVIADAGRGTPAIPAEGKI